MDFHPNPTNKSKKQSNWNISFLFGFRSMRMKTITCLRHPNLGRKTFPIDLLVEWALATGQNPLSMILMLLLNYQLIEAPLVKLHSHLNYARPMLLLLFSYLWSRKENNSIKIIDFQTKCIKFSFTIAPAVPSYDRCSCEWKLLNFATFHEMFSILWIIPAIFWNVKLIWSPDGAPSAPPNTFDIRSSNNLACCLFREKKEVPRYIRVWFFLLKIWWFQM